VPLTNATVLTDRFDCAVLYATHVYATHVHGGQVRKGTSTPYVAHLVLIARHTLARPGGSRISSTAPVTDMPRR
jgi:hypothetical protein